MITATAHTVAASGQQGPSDFLLYIVYPTIVGSALLFVGWLGTISRRLTTQDKALGLLIAQVSPEEGPSLRDVVQANAQDLALVKQRQGDRWEAVQEALAELRTGVRVKPEDRAP